MDVQALWLAIDDEENAEDDTENDYLDTAGLIVGIAVITAEEQRQRCAERRSKTRLYHVRGDLLPNSRESTPRQTLYTRRKWGILRGEDGKHRRGSLEAARRDD